MTVRDFLLAEFGFRLLLGKQIYFQDLTDLSWDGAQLLLCLLLQGLVQFQRKGNLHPFRFGVFFHMRVTSLYFKGYSLKNQ